MNERRNLVDMIKKYDEKVNQIRLVESKLEFTTIDLDNAMKKIEDNCSKIKIFEAEKLDLQKKVDFEKNRLVQEEKKLIEKVSLF